MVIFVVVKASSGEDTNLGYNPSADVLGAFKKLDDAERLFNHLIQEEKDVAKEIDDVIINEITGSEVEVINESEDSCCSYKIDTVELL